MMEGGREKYLSICWVPLFPSEITFEMYDEARFSLKDVLLNFSWE